MDRLQGFNGMQNFMGMQSGAVGQDQSSNLIGSLIEGIQNGTISTEELQALETGHADQQTQISNYLQNVLSTIDQYKQDTTGTAAELSDLTNSELMTPLGFSGDESGMNMGPMMGGQGGPMMGGQMGMGGPMMGGQGGPMMGGQMGMGGPMMGGQGGPMMGGQMGMGGQGGQMMGGPMMGGQMGMGGQMMGGPMMGNRSQMNWGMNNQG